MSKLYLHPSSRITKVSLCLQGHDIDLFCVYAHSGANVCREREEFFDKELFPLFRNKSDKAIIGGDWNSIISDRDCSNPRSSYLSKNLKNIVQTVGFKDVHNLTNRIPEYTFMRQNYASRLDRIYAAKYAAGIRFTKTVPVSFSDHSCFYFDLGFENIFLMGKSYWKLNCAILREAGVKDDFKDLWDRLKREKYKYESILHWWDFVKGEIKSFYIEICKLKNYFKYNLLNGLESRLRKLYDSAYVTGKPDMKQIEEVKDRIEKIRDDLAEGIKIRAREKELQCGEKISKYLINKQRSISAKKLLTGLKDEDGNEITSFQSIQSHVTRFYANLYKHEPSSIVHQEKFLDYVKCCLDDSDREELCKEVTKKEIFIIIKSFTRNRTPGLDGLPIEFYLENWNIIADEFVEIVKFSIINRILCQSQRKGVITITPKDGDKKLLKNWRPISLLCVDYKIISKLLAKRMQLHLEKVIDNNQYCSVPGRSIVNCNMFIRDIVYFVNNENIEAGFLKVDWHKAFDMVNLDFLFKVMEKMGFGDGFIGLIRMLYTDIESAMLINNHIGNFFPLTRSVRQGCPLSMILYTIYQEPFYAAIREISEIEPLVLPDHSKVKSIGYADDTNIIIKSEKSLVEIDKVITEFEYATKSLVNRNNKSKIFGMGKWANKSDWPITWCSLDKGVCKILGISHCNNYIDSVKLNWTDVYCKIESHIRILNSRKLDLFQRASYVNICILSKAWYIAHIYPLCNEIYIKVKKAIFRYIWIGNYEPVKRATVCMGKEIGGLGVFDFFTKANCIILNSFLKSYILEKGNQGLISYYCQDRMKNVIPRDYWSPMIYGTASPYYVYIMNLISKCQGSVKFPVFKNKELYSIFLKTEQITVECKYPLFNWKRIWKNFNSSKIVLYKREFVYKHLHDVLAVGKRMYEFGLSTSAVCSLCGYEESAIHLFYFCEKVKPVFRWILDIIERICLFRPTNGIKFIYFDFKIVDNSRKNMCILLLYSYLHAVWLVRANRNISVSGIKNVVLKNYQNNVKDLKLSLGENIRKFFGNLLNANI